MPDDESAEETDEQGGTNEHDSDTPEAIPPVFTIPFLARPVEHLDVEVRDLIEMLERLKEGKGEHWPKLLDHLAIKTPAKKEIDKNAFRGGYQHLLVTSIVPGEELTHSYLNGLSETERKLLRKHVKKAIM